MDSHRRMMEEEIQAHFKKTDENGLEKAPGHMDLDRLAVPVLKENFDRGRRLGRRHAEYTEKHGRHQVVGDLNENRRPLPRLVKEGGVRG